MNESPSEQKTLVHKVADLEAEKHRLEAIIERLERELAMMRQQEVAMAALFRGATPTMEGRVACARILSPEKLEDEI